MLPLKSKTTDFKLHADRAEHAEDQADQLVAEAFEHAKASKLLAERLRKTLSSRPPSKAEPRELLPNMIPTASEALMPSPSEVHQMHHETSDQSDWFAVRPNREQKSVFSWHSHATSRDRKTQKSSATTRSSKDTSGKRYSHLSVKSLLLQYEKCENPGYQVAAFMKTKSSHRPEQRNDCLAVFVRSPLFDLISGFSIITNSMFLGAHIEYLVNHHREGQPEPVIFDVLRYTYMFIFLIELLLRICAQGKGFFFSPSWAWNYFDIVVVSSGIVDVMSDVVAQVGDSNSLDVSSMRLIRVIRITRVIRVLKIGRIVRFVRALRELVNSIIGTLRSLCWSIVLLCVILYAFGIALTHAVVESEGDEENSKLVRLYFGSVGRSMFTLFKALTNGMSWHEVSTPLEKVGSLYVIIFLVYICFAYFAVLNVITSAFCSSAIDSAQRDVDTMIHNQLRHNQAYVSLISELFENLDVERTGFVSKQDFIDCLDQPEIQAFLSSIELDSQDATMLFEMMDVDKSDAISMEQFTMACVRLKGGARNIDMARLLRQSQWSVNKLRSVSERVLEIQGRLERLEERPSTLT